MDSAHSTLARRDLFRGAAALLGGSSLGLLPALAGASLGTAAPLTLGFWNGSRFVDAASLAHGDPSLDRVRLTVAGTGGVSVIEAHAPSSGARYPFTLWVAPPGGIGRSVARLATEPNGDLVLGVFVGADRREIRLVGGAGPSAKLREGRYLLTAGRLTGFGMDDAGKVVAQGATPYVVLNVERA